MHWHCLHFPYHLSSAPFLCSVYFNSDVCSADTVNSHTGDCALACTEEQSCRSWFLHTLPTLSMHACNVWVLPEGKVGEKRSNGQERGDLLFWEPSMTSTQFLSGVCEYDTSWYIWIPPHQALLMSFLLSLLQSARQWAVLPPEGRS